MQDRTLADVVTEYKQLFQSPANAWGQHVHPQYGVSHNMLRMMFNQFGQQEVLAECERQDI